MDTILGKAKTIRELLNGVKYSIDYYQREYKWQEKHIQELINDLTSKFRDDYQETHSRNQVQQYGNYFLGSIIISSKNGENYIVDGQQRLTSITLLLIYLNNLQQDRDEKVNIDELIFSEKYGKRSFNINVDERIPYMEDLYKGNPINSNDKSESVSNMLARYQNIDEQFPEDLRGDALPFFIDWLIDNVHLIEITAYSDDDAYTIFETMNDRGLSLTPTDMLKGYLLANISDTDKRNLASGLWKSRIKEIDEISKDAESDFFKAWLRSQYAEKIRERKKNSKQEDFDRMGTEYHRWLRESSEKIGLKQSDEFYRFIETNFNFYSQQYLLISKASNEVLPQLEHILFNANQGFSLQNMVLLAPIDISDNENTINKKLRVTAQYIDILLTWRLWNFHSNSYSTLQYAMFLVMRDIRRKSLPDLIQILQNKLNQETITFASNDRFSLHEQNRPTMKRILARISDFVDTASGLQSRYLEYMNDDKKKRYEIEHIWANKSDQHTDEFSHPTDFEDYRNHIGGLLLLPRSFNESYGALPYTDKLEHYNSQNLLARSLHQQCYERNPGFLKFISDCNLPFHPHPEFKKKDLDERGELYRKLAELIWNPLNLAK